MPVHQFLRAAAVAVVIPLTTACDTTVPPADASQPPKPPAPQTRTYAMTEGDSVGPICVHLDMPYSARICPDTSFYANYFLPSEVVAETLVVRTRNGRNIRIALPNRADAIFLTRSATSTFLLRHYDATDPVKAAELRRFMGSGRYRPRGR